MSLRSVLMTSVAAFAVSASAHAATFGLEGSVGDSPSFSVTSGGMTATFTSPAGNGFTVQSTAGLLSFGTALLDNNFFGTDPLTITFSSPVLATFSIPFAVLDSYSTTDTFTVMANTAQTATYAAVPDSLALGEPEGVASFTTKGAVTSLTMTGTSAFAVGDISTSAVAATPEPASLMLLVTGMAGVAGTVLRRRQAAL